MGLIHKYMQVTEHLTRSEERDRWLGRLFGLKAIVMSGSLFQPSEGGVSQEREFRTVLGEILDLGKEKSWLREPGMWTIAAAAKQFSWDRNYVGMVWKMICERELARTSEGVGVWLCFEELCPGTTAEVEEGKIWGDGRWGPLTGGHLATLAKVLKDSGAAGGQGNGAGEGGNAGEKNGEQGQGKAKKGGKGSGVGGKGVWSPKLHWVWDEIISIFLAQETTAFSAEEPESEKKRGSKKDKKYKEINHAAGDTIAPFSQFWLIVVDESLFSAASSEERKFHGFLLLIKMFNLLISAPQYIPTLLPHLFTKNLLRCTINHLSDPSRYLHKSAAKTISTIQQLASAQPQAIPLILRGLILGNGTTGFDRLTKTKTVEKLLTLVGGNENALKEVVEIFRDIIVTPPIIKAKKGDEEQDGVSAEDDDNDEEKENVKAAKREEESKRQWAADQLLLLIRSGKGKKHDSWTAMVVELFAILGHFDIEQIYGGAESVVARAVGSKVPTPKISEPNKSMFRARLASVLGHLLNLEGEEIGDTWPYRAVKVIQETIAAGAALAMEFDEHIETAVRSGWEKLETIRAKRAKIISGGNEKGNKERGSEVSQLQAFELLYSLVLLQTYNGDSDAVELLQELEVCYGKIMKDATASEGKKKKAQKETAPDDSVDVSAILVDLILSFLAKPSVLLRKIAGSVWSSFVGTAAVGKSALDALMEVLETKESLVGQQALFDKEEDDEDDVEMDSDVEEIMPHDDNADEVEDTMDVDEDYKGVKLSATNIEGSEEKDDGSDTDMSTSSSGESDEETDLPTDDETTKFEEALSKALKTKKVVPGQKDEPESDSDADMTDSEMAQLDKHLSIMFRERMKKLRAPQTKKKERGNARENILAFKGKVVELLEAYVKGRFGGGKESHTTGDGGLFLVCVVPRLLGAMRTTGKPQLREKLSGVIRLFFREFGKGNTHGAGNDEVGLEQLRNTLESIQLQELWKTLDRIHEEVLKEGGGPAHTAACSMSSIGIVKALLRNLSGEEGAQMVERITGSYGKTMTKWLLSGGVGGGTLGGSTLQIQSFFTDFVGWGGSVRKAAAANISAKKEKNAGDLEKTVKDKGNGSAEGVKEKVAKKEKSGKKQKGGIKMVAMEVDVDDIKKKEDKKKAKEQKEGKEKEKSQKEEKVKAKEGRMEVKDKKVKKVKSEEMESEKNEKKDKEKEKKEGKKDQEKEKRKDKEKAKEGKKEKAGKRDLVVGGGGVEGEQTKKSKRKSQE